jgi:endonuclease I
MRPLFFLLLAMPAFAVAQSVSITSPGTPVTQNFDALAVTGTSTVLPAGWYILETGTNSNGIYTANDGSGNAGDTYSFGAINTPERALGGLQSGSLIPSIGAAFANNTGAPITTLIISYTGEMWRAGVTNRNAADRLDFQYSLDATSLATGIWTDVNELDFSSPVISTAAGALNGNVAPNRTAVSFTISGLSIPSGAIFYIRWTDFGIASNDDGLAIDDFSLTASGGTLPACVEPAAQPTTLAGTSISTTGFTVGWTHANPQPDAYLVTMGLTADVPADKVPVNGTSYEIDDAIGNGKVVYSGSGNSFSLAGLQPGTAYYFYIWSYNQLCTGGPLYRIAQPLRGSISTMAPPACTTPQAAPTGLVLTPSNTGILISFTAAASADSYLTVISTQANPGFTPANGVSYTPGQIVGNVTVVAYSTSPTASATGLSPATQYYVFVYSVSGQGCTGGPLYLTTSLSSTATTTQGGSGIPPGYYDLAAGKACADLKTALFNITTTGMTPRTYASLWEQYPISDVKSREKGNGSATVIWDIYSDIPGPNNDPYNYTPVTQQCGNYSVEGDCYNREHSVPQNWYGASANSGSIGPESDYHHVFPTDGKVNNYRGNFIFGEVTNPTLTSLNGSKLGPVAVGGLTGTAFEPINEYKGDVARAFLYFVTRYQNNMPGWPGGTSGTQAFDPTTYPSVDIPYLKLMLKWHNQDPVSQKETDRNNAAYIYQGNRNPFVDHPEYADLVWNSTCTGLGALPVTLISMVGKLNGSRVELTWEVASETNLRGYTIQRSTNGSDFQSLQEVNAAGRSTYSWADDIQNLTGRRLYYRLAMTDIDGSIKYSGVYSVHVPLHNLFTTWPNPVHDRLFITLAAPVRYGTLTITDAAGRTLQSQSLQQASGNLQLSTRGLPAGTYILRLQTNDGLTMVQRFVK